MFKYIIILYFFFAIIEEHITANIVKKNNFTQGYLSKTFYQIKRTSFFNFKTQQSKNYFSIELAGDNDTLWADHPILKQFSHITIIMNENQNLYFDFFLHGSNQIPFCIYIPNLHFSKFLHQSVAFKNASENLIRTQAFFAEFSRKTKKLFLSPNMQNNTPFHSMRSKFLLNSRVVLNQTIQQKLSKATTPSHFLSTYNSSKISSFSLSPIANEVLENMGILKTLRKIEYVMFTNNCREPGNYEFSLKDYIRRPIYRCNFTIPIKRYDLILKNFHGHGISEQGTGINIPKYLYQKNKFYYKGIANYRYSFPETKQEELKKVFIQPKEFKSSYFGDIHVSKGKIPYLSVLRETQEKSTHHHEKQDPLSYVKIINSNSPPEGFQVPVHYKSKHALEYWNSKLNQGKVVPHRFLNFKDLYNHYVYLSDFSASGIYKGDSDIGIYAREKADGRSRFSWLNRFL